MTSACRVPGLRRLLMLAVAIALASIGAVAPASAVPVSTSRFSVPASARELVVVSSAGYDPPDHLASFRTFERASVTSPWRAAFPAWHAEIGSGDGSGELVNVRLEGDHATPTGVYGFGLTMYGNDSNPGGLHYAYHQLVCGDWWDEDPYSAQYNEFVHVPCGETPSFAAWSEALWTETTAYPYFAVIDYNMDPTVSGADAPGSGIFFHAWVGGATEGCVALPIPQLLRVLRWIRPDDHPVIEIGTDAELGRVPPPA